MVRHAKISSRSRLFIFSSILGASCLLLSTGSSWSLPDNPPPSSPKKIPIQNPSVTFSDVTKEAGITFVHSFGDKQFSNLVEAVGGGVAWLDYDRDGWIDLYFATGKYHPGVSQGKKPKEVGPNRLYRNRGDGTFEDRTDKAGVGCLDCFSMGITVADYDNDGWVDIYVANHGPNVLFRNNGDGTFKDVTKQAGVGDAGCSVAATWFDLDRDGHLDIYVGNYIEFDPDYTKFYAPDGFPGPLAYPAQPDALYRNRGDRSFEKINAQESASPKGRAMSVTAADYDGDGDDDLYVTNDATENFLFKNQDKGRLEEVALFTNVAFSGMADQTASMAVDFGDYNRDGRLDIFVSDNSLCSLYRNDGERFVDVAAPTGVARASAQFVGWGAFFFDFDNDGDLDILKVNSDLSRLFGQEDQVFENTGDGHYRDVSTRMGPYFREDRMGRGAAFADYDNDGDLDVAINNIGGPAVLLRNEGGSLNQSLSLKLVGKKSNRDGIGARITVLVGNEKQTSQKRSSGGYLSQNDPRLFFGLGQMKKAKRIEVLWPSGQKQVLEDVSADSMVTIEEPTE